MIKIYRLKIADKIYEVELEDISEKEGNIEKKVSVPKLDNVKAETTKSSIASSGENIKTVEAPMQGVILNIGVAVGDSVSEGDELVILEAMKMENPILSPYSGTIVEIGVSKGDNVDDGTVLVKIG